MSSSEPGAAGAPPHAPSATALLSQALALTGQLLESSRPEGEADDSQQAVLQALRSLRNACAGDAAACEQLLGLGLVTLLRNVVRLVQASVISLNWQVPLVAAQAIANAANTSAAFAAAAWAALFPLQLTTLAHVCSEPLQSALSMGVLACCKRVPGAAQALAGPAGGTLLTALLCSQTRLQQESKDNDTLVLLLSHLCFEMDLLSDVFANLGGDDADAGAGGARGPPALRPTMAHVTLLQELSAEVQGHRAAAVVEPGEEPSARSGSSMRCLVETIRAVAEAGRGATLSEGQQQLLQDSLQLLRDIAGLDDDGRGLASVSLVEEATSAGLVQLLLCMLKALGPISNPQSSAAAGPSPQPAAANGGSKISSLAAGIDVAELAPELRSGSAGLPLRPPYRGYRADVLSVLANLSYGRAGVKAAVQAVGGVELVLSQCQMDREAPLAREWGLWAIRNLCEGNEAAQMAIQELQLCATVDSEELRQMGVQVQVEEGSGKMKVVQRQPPPAEANLS